MNEDLKNLINHININFIKFSELWEKNNPNNRINLKKKFVKDIRCENDIFNQILAYQSFLLKKTVELELALKKKIIGNVEILTRIKTVDSISYKVNRYINEKSEKGFVPICKCLNDIFGARIILNETVDIEELKNFLKYNYPNLRVIDSSKKDYKANHIYFCKTNYDFRWELQIWHIKNKNINIESHAKYKQSYTNWVKKRGEKND